mgnify:CR=1 FL=1
MVIAHGQRQRRIAPIIFRARIGAGLKEHLGDPLAPLTGGHHQRRGAVGGARVDVRSALEKEQRNVVVAVEHRVVQCPPIVAVAINRRAILEQPLHGRKVPVPNRKLQRLLTVAIGPTRIGAARDEQLHHFNVAMPGGIHQPGAKLAAFEFWIKALVKPLRYFSDIPALNGPTEGHRIG